MNTKDKLNLMNEINAANEKHIAEWKEDRKTYKIVMIAGTVKKDMSTGLSFKNAVEICEYYGWEVSPDGDGGFVWDLEIEEE